MNYDDVEYVDGIPDTSLMPKMGKTGYSLSEGIAELADNAIDEMLDTIKLKIDISITNEEITAVDNAGGMDKDEIITAMILAKAKKEKGKHGLYGLGLKTACVSMGEYFEVISAKKGSNEAWMTWWDEEEWMKRRNWKHPRKKVPIPKELKHGYGTVVRIKKLRYKAGNKINQVRGDLGRRFAPYMGRNIITIIVNSQNCKAIKPEIDEKTKKEFYIKTQNGPIHGWIALMKSSSQKHKYGFDTFRNYRMITCYEKLGFKPHATVARITGELHMDHVPVTTNKREWEKTSPLYEEAEILVAAEIKDIVVLSRKRTTQKKVQTKDVNKLEQFKEGLKEAMKDDELKEYTLPERKVPEINNKDIALDDIPTKPEDVKIIVAKTNVEVEKRTKPAIPDKGTRIPTGMSSKRNPKVTHTVKRNIKTIIPIKGREFDYNHEWATLGINGPMYRTEFDKENRKLDVFTNIDFPAAKITNDLAFYAFSLIVEAVSTIMVSESNAEVSKFDDIRYVLMRESSKYVTQLLEVK